LIDEGTFEELFTDLEPIDALNFMDTESYKQRLTQAQNKSGKKDAAIVGTGLVNGQKIALGVLDFSFMAGSMGSVVGEKLTRIIEHATHNQLPVVIVSASGGARMQESILSLMQMAKTSAALARHSDAALPYISILTNPTTGGVTASFATLGDVIIAEPKALIAFAGPRVVEQTIRQKLPEGAQKSEFLIEKGMIDCIVNRHQLKNKLSQLIDYLTPSKEGADLVR
jgi:acetyl-CoA carboxylase carboxyl transferase subunit beta